MPRFSVWIALGLLSIPLLGSADDWPQWQGPMRDGIWRETGIIRDFSAGEPKVTWRAEVAGGYSGPAISEGRVFLTDYVREEGDAVPNSDARNVLKGIERILCFDEMTGKLIWKHEYSRGYNISYPAGPRATPTVDGDHVYTLGAEGDLICLRVTNGEVIWSSNLAEEYNTKTPIWGYAAHPLIVGTKLICLAGGKGSAAVALDKTTGQEIWRALTTKDIGYSPPTIIEAGGVSQLLIWHSESLNSLNPKNGELYWSEALKPDYQMSIAPPLLSKDVLYVAAIKNKSMALRLDADRPAATLMWKGGTRAGVAPSHCPVVADSVDPDYVYGVDRGGLRCIKLSDGKHQWETFDLMANKRSSSAGTIFITQNGDRFFLFSETGQLSIAKLSPIKFEEIGRSEPLLEPTHNSGRRRVVWSAPAYANKAMFVRNDKELIRVSLAE